MKTLLNLTRTLCLSVIGYCLCAATAHAGTTNVITKITVENSTLGTTNNVTYSLNQGGGSAKDDLTIDSLVWYYAYVKSSGLYTNVFEQWLKDSAKTALQAHNAEKSATDALAIAIAKIYAAIGDTSAFSATSRSNIIAAAATLP